MFICVPMCVDFMWVCCMWKELRYAFESKAVVRNIFYFLLRHMIWFTLIGIAVICAHKY